MADSVVVDAFAKLNLGLMVGSRGSDGFHPLHSLTQSISWADRLTIATAEEDTFTATGIEASEDNLAWRAASAVRAAASSGLPLSVHLDKQVAVAAGLGGGSADAAAVLAVCAPMFGVGGEQVAELAEGLGSDIPFCLHGGLAILEGRGERVEAQPFVPGFSLGIVVPPVELSTPDVYGRWDDIGGPSGRAFPPSALPPGLRSFEPLRNDLQPAAESLAPEVGEWQSELEARWGRPVAMTGSGPALFAFFLDEEEAEAAIAARPHGARAAQAAVPVPQGWREVPGTLAGPE